MHDTRVRVRRIVFGDDDESSAALLHDPKTLVRLPSTKFSLLPQRWV